MQTLSAQNQQNKILTSESDTLHQSNHTHSQHLFLGLVYKPYEFDWLNGPSLGSVLLQIIPIRVFPKPTTTYCPFGKDIFYQYNQNLGFIMFVTPCIENLNHNAGIVYCLDFQLPSSYPDPGRIR